MKILTHDGIIHELTISHRKDHCFKESYIGLIVGHPSADAVVEAVDLRIYQTKSTTYVCLWCFAMDCYVSGSGKAGGYGYHHASAAAQEAITNAGYAIDTSIDGRGDSAIREAVEAICKFHYPDSSCYVVHAHG